MIKKKKVPITHYSRQAGKNVRKVINNLVSVRLPLRLIAVSERMQILMVSD